MRNLRRSIVCTPHRLLAFSIMSASGGTPGLSGGTLGGQIARGGGGGEDYREGGHVKNLLENLKFE